MRVVIAIGACVQRISHTIIYKTHTARASALQFFASLFGSLREYSVFQINPSDGTQKERKKSQGDDSLMSYFSLIIWFLQFITCSLRVISGETVCRQERNLGVGD
jgi:hypothetical protein